MHIIRAAPLIDPSAATVTRWVGLVSVCSGRPGSISAVSTTDGGSALPASFAAATA